MKLQAPPSTISTDADSAARARDNAHALLRSVRREALELPAKLAEAKRSNDGQQMRALYERRQRLPVEIRMARISTLAATIESLKPQLDALSQTERTLAGEAAQIFEQRKALEARLKTIDAQLIDARQKLSSATRRMTRVTETLEAEQDYMISPEFMNNLASSVWVQIPANADEGLELLAAQIETMRSSSRVDGAHAADDARLLALLRDARKGLYGAVSTGEKETLLRNLREHLALILA